MTLNARGPQVAVADTTSKSTDKKVVSATPSSKRKRGDRSKVQADNNQELPLKKTRTLRPRSVR